MPIPLSTPVVLKEGRIEGRKERDTKTPFDQEISEMPTTVHVGKVCDLLKKDVFFSWNGG